MEQGLNPISSTFSQPRVAIVHYWLVSNRGGERVLERLCKLYPQADIFTHVYDPDVDFGLVSHHRIQTSFIGKLPFAKRFYQHYLPLMPLATEQLDLTNYDLIISSEAGPAKGGIRHPDATHVCYVHSPMRYLWDQYKVYSNQFGLASRLASPLAFHYLRNWDYISAQRIDAVIANSSFVKRRIRHVWGREATVVHPPVAVSEFTPQPSSIDKFYLWVGQLVPYKRPDIAIDACTRLGLPLVVVGTGAMKQSLARRAGPTVRFIDRLSYADLKLHYACCRALLFTGEEDFGITPVEVLASGRPVIALGKGGVLETIVDGQTGIFFNEPTVESLIEVLCVFDEWIIYFNPAIAVQHAQAFSPEQFDVSFKALLSYYGF